MKDLLSRQSVSRVGTHASILVLAGVLSACSSSTGSKSVSTTSEDIIAKSEMLSEREVALAKKEAELRNKEAMLATQSSGGTNVQLDNELLPPNAEPGHCYARVWVEPTYTTRTEQVLVSEASEKIEIIPAQYQMVSEQVLITPESTKLVTIPATYETITEQKLVKDGGLFWRTSLKGGALASQSTLDDAKAYGIDLASATPGMCFHEHIKPAKYAMEEEQVLIQEASEQIIPIEAEYRWVEKQVLVSAAYERLETVPAQYKTVTEQILDKPAHTVWKKGSGPIQKIDSATGEIMCLVEVPASYKTVTKQVLVSPATTRSITVPAEYKTVRVKELINDASERREVIPAKYKTVSRRVQVAEATPVWHEVHDTSMSADSRTGRKICLTEDKPVYQTIQRRVVKTPAQTRKEIIPAKYQTVEVQKVAQAAQERKVVIPASYRTVNVKEVASEGKMEWRSILCDTNMTPGLISKLQQRLKSEGYDPGPIDGRIGTKTMEAVNSYQRDNQLPVDKYLNIETIEHMKISWI